MEEIREHIREHIRARIIKEMLCMHTSLKIKY